MRGVETSAVSGDLLERISTLLDANFYLETQGVSGVGASSALEHFSSRGRLEGRNPNALFDGAFYKLQLGSRSIQGDPLSDYLEIGAGLGLWPHPLFDPQYYSAQIERAVPLERLLEHYLTVGWRLGLSPHPLFDPEYYQATAELEPSDVAPLVHYLTRDEYSATPHYLFSDETYLSKAGLTLRDGRRQALEGAVPLVHYVRFGAKLRISTHPLFDPAFYASAHARQVERTGTTHKDPALVLEPDLLRHYVEHGWRKKISPTPFFDVPHYTSQVAAALTEDPLRHYLTPGNYGVDTPHPGFELDYYADRAGFYSDDVPAILHLLATPEAERLSPHPSFDPIRYRAIYPDIAKLDGGAIEHFLAHGMDEDRSPNEWFSHDYVFNSFPQHDFGRDSAVHKYFSGDMPKRPRMVFVSHDAGLTGAPGTILRVQEDFSRLYDVECFSIVAGSGPRIADFKRSAHTVLVNEPFHAASREKLARIADQLIELTAGNTPVAAIVNSAESRAMGVELARVGIPVISLIHEAADLYPQGAFAPIVASSSRMVFGSQFVFNRAAQDMDLPAELAIVRGQGLQQDFVGRLPRHLARKAVIEELHLDEDVFLVLGCGSIDYRKGADFFVKAAIEFLERHGKSNAHVCFVWVGEGASHSIIDSFIRSEVRRNDIAQHVRFIGGREDVEPYFMAADAFLMTSRVDPFPCVVQEAMAAGLPVVAFTEGGGTIEMIGDEAGYCVPLGDTVAMADRLTVLFSDHALRGALGDRGRRIVRERWNPHDYCHFLAGLVADVAGKRLTRLEQRQPEAAKGRVFVLLDDWQQNPSSAAAQALVEELNGDGVAAEIVLSRGRFSKSLESGYAHPLPEVPYRFLQPATVAFEDGRWRTNAYEVWRSLRDLCRQHHPCLVLGLSDDLGVAVGTALPSPVGLVATLQSGADAIDRAYAAGPHLDLVLVPSGLSSSAEKLVEHNPALAAKLRIVPPATGPIYPAAEYRNSILVRADLSSAATLSRLLELNRSLRRQLPDHRLIVHADALPPATSFAKVLSSTGLTEAAVLLAPSAGQTRTALAASAASLFLGEDASLMPLLSESVAAGAVPIVVDPSREIERTIAGAGIALPLRHPSDEQISAAVVWAVAEGAPLLEQGRRWLRDERGRAAPLAVMLSELLSTIANEGTNRPVRLGSSPRDVLARLPLLHQPGAALLP